MGVQIGYFMIRRKDLSRSQNSCGSFSGSGVGPQVPVLCGYGWTGKANTFKAVARHIFFHIVKERGSFFEVPFIVKAGLQNAIHKAKEFFLTNGVVHHRLRKQAQQKFCATESLRIPERSKRALIFPNQSSSSCIGSESLPRGHNPLVWKRIIQQLLSVKEILTESGQSLWDMIHCSPSLQLKFQLRFYIG